MNIQRYLDLLNVVNKKSLFLLGPRQTGKSWLIRNAFKDHYVYNLLDNATFLRLSRDTNRMREEYIGDDKIVIIDEIQRLPILLNTVHLMIEEQGARFLLTGSSARKLRRAGVNLLGGRANVLYFHPLSFCELRENLDLLRAVNYGTLPSVYLSQNPEEDLTAYIALYLKEEIATEGLTRNVPAFSRFLEIAALCNGKIINFTKIANDAQVARTTVQEYFQILKDTLIAFELPVWQKSLKRKPINTSKYYLFDTGVVRKLQRRAPLLDSVAPEFGELFEAYIAHELKTYADYHQIDELAYWRTVTGFEVDFILGNQTAIEVKASRNVSMQDLKNLSALGEEQKLKNYIVVCQEDRERVVDHGIRIMPWRIFLERLWSDELVLAI